MAKRLRLRLQGSDGTVYGDLEPPPSKVLTFTPHWIRWIFNVFSYLSGVNDLINANASVVIAPSMTTTERDAMTATNGMIIYNTTTTVFNFYENSAWVTK